MGNVEGGGEHSILLLEELGHDVFFYAVDQVFLLLLIHVLEQGVCLQALPHALHSKIT